MVTLASTFVDQNDFALRTVSSVSVFALALEGAFCVEAFSVDIAIMNAQGTFIDVRTFSTIPFKSVFTVTA